MAQTHGYEIDWADLPVPEDDGAAAHLQGMRLPALELKASDGAMVDLAALGGCTVIYAYPKTGQPGTPLPDGWDGIPGARGCTPQSCAFRDHYAELRALGVDHLFGLSTQDSAWQAEAAERLHLPFAILSDADLALATSLSLPVMEIAGETLLKRMALVVDNGMISKVFYPVFPPDQNAEAVLAWLRDRAAS